LPTCLLKPLQKGRVTSLRLLFIQGGVHEHADATHTVTLLRPRRNRPNRRAADNTKKFPPPHVSLLASRGNIVTLKPLIWKTVTASLLLSLVFVAGAHPNGAPPCGPHVFDAIGPADCPLLIRYPSRGPILGALACRSID